MGGRSSTPYYGYPAYDPYMNYYRHSRRRRDYTDYYEYPYSYGNPYYYNARPYNPISYAVFIPYY